jgi:hypothetical protein
VTEGADETWLGVQTLAYAGLDAVLAVHSLDLCAYLHVGSELGPQLYLRRPTLGALDPAEAFSLFGALRDLLDEPGDGPLTVAGFEAVAIASRGPASRGLWVAGTKDRPLDPAARRASSELGRAMMLLCHEAERVNTGAQEPSIVRVSTETTAEGVRAEVAVLTPTGEQVGRGEAGAPLAAVAWASLAAVDPSVKLLAAEEDVIDQTRVVLVLLRDGNGRTTVGSALVESDPLRAAAMATLTALAPPSVTD